MPYFLPCEIDRMCAALEHTWLKHRLLGQIALNRDQWIESSENVLPSVFAALLDQVQKVRAVVSQVMDGFSPAQLVEKTPLSALDADDKEVIKSVIHRAYLDLDLIQPLLRELQEATTQMEEIASRMIYEWNISRQSRVCLIDEVEVAATRLRKAFLGLPREVVLP